MLKLTCCLSEKNAAGITQNSILDLPYELYELNILMLLSFFCSQKLALIITNVILSHDVVSGSDITPCNKIDKPLVVNRFRNVT